MEYLQKQLDSGSHAPQLSPHGAVNEREGWGCGREIVSSDRIASPLVWGGTSLRILEQQMSGGNPVLAGGDFPTVLGEWAPTVLIKLF